MVMFKISKSPELEHVLSPVLSRQHFWIPTSQSQLQALGRTSLIAHSDFNRVGVKHPAGYAIVKARKMSHRNRHLLVGIPTPLKNMI